MIFLWEGNLGITGKFVFVATALLALHKQKVM